MLHASLTPLAFTCLASGALAQGFYTVDTTADTADANPGDGICADATGACSLRAAIQEANAQGGAVILLPAGAQFTLTLAGSGEDAAASGDLDVTGNLRIIGAGADIDAAGLDRAFDVLPGGQLELHEVTVHDGSVTAESGGGLRSAGTLLMERCVVFGCSALGAGASGGAVFNDGGTLNVLDSTLRDCTATRAGGGIEANAGLTRLEFTDLLNNETGPMPGNGGGLHLTGDGDVIVRFSLAEGNVAASEGGGLWNSAVGLMIVTLSEIRENSADGTAADNGGGGLFNDGGDLFVSFSQVRDNTATVGSGSGGGILNDGGALDLQQVAVRGNISNRAGGGIEVVGGITTIDRCFVSSNSTGAAPGNGGGLHITGPGSVTVTDSDFNGNFASAEGGGLWNSAVGTLDIRRSAIEGNVASGNDADQGGGGLFNDGGDMDVIRCTLTANVADGLAGSGGGILNNTGDLFVSRTRMAFNDAQRAGGGVEANVGTTTLSRVQLLRNACGAAPGNGGGLHLTGPGDVNVNLSFVTSNAAANEGGGLWNSATGTMIVTNTSITGNTAPFGPNNFNDGGTFTVDGVPVP